MGDANTSAYQHQLVAAVHAVMASTSSTEQNAHFQHVSVRFWHFRKVALRHFESATPACLDVSDQSLIDSHIHSP